MTYKGIEYNIRSQPGGNEWVWTVYPPEAKSIEGRVKGPRERAVVAAHDAIDRWLKDRSAQSD